MINKTIKIIYKFKRKIYKLRINHQVILLKWKKQQINKRMQLTILILSCNNNNKFQLLTIIIHYLNFSQAQETAFILMI